MSFLINNVRFHVFLVFVVFVHIILLITPTVYIIIEILVVPRAVSLAEEIRIFIVKIVTSRIRRRIVLKTVLLVLCSSSVQLFRILAIVYLILGDIPLLFSPNFDHFFVILHATTRRLIEVLVVLLSVVLVV